METLPIEIVQEISWLALNPSLYFVSKQILSKLPPFHDFTNDLALVLFCERDLPDSPWANASPFPWKTGQACKQNLKLTIHERHAIQEILLDSPFFTLKFFKYAVSTLTSHWLSFNFPPSRLSATAAKELYNFLSTDYLDGHHASFFSSDPDNGEFLYIQYLGQMSLNTTSDIIPRTGAVFVDTLCIPSKLFLTRTRENLKLLQHLRQCTQPSHLSFPNELMRQALHDTILDQDYEYFITLFGCTRRHHFDIPGETMRDELIALAIEHKKWKSVEILVQGFQMPERFLELTLMPALQSALAKGGIDSEGAGRLKHFIEVEGWGNIKQRQYVDTY